jgi:hypothetical protein
VFASEANDAFSSGNKLFHLNQVRQIIPWCPVHPFPVCACEPCTHSEKGI